ncbi:SDR family NAD(P)-dependent oxidoreductase [Streptomyces mirabilis]|uniref:SDR family NAD(P)-dependent oxidoreductase n=1 Tax=Streptomyces mirabilis TaxID=68239 RepID=UPI0022BB7F09|nr:SDR family oxidoreductase [Streptomyces mirabilis]
MNRLDGKVAVVTGGSSGIGFATAQQFVEEGAFVFITGRRRPELDKAKDEIGRNVTAVQGDVSVSADLDRLFGTVAEEKGKIDVVVANSGLVDPQVFVQITEASFDRVFNVNARGTLFTAQNALPLMNDGGSIILVGSIAGHVGTPIMDSQADSKEGADAIRAAFASVVPLGRMGRPEEVAAAAVFLASDESSFCAGTELSVDGGMAQV